MADIAGTATAALNGSGGGGVSVGNVGSSPAPAASPNPAPASSPPAATPASPLSGQQQQPAASSSPAPGGSNPAGTGGGSPGGNGDWLGVRDAVRQYGFDLGANIQDDHQALQQLVLMAQRSQQLEQMAQYGRLYMQHAGQFQEWQRQQAEAQQRAQAQQNQWFKAPEWNAAWQNQIVRDPQTGEYKPAPGAPPDVVQKYLAGLQHQRQFLEQFAFDPIGAIKPGIEQLIKEQAQQIVQQQLGGYQDRTFASNFIQQNSGWLYQRDANGNQVSDLGGNPILSQWGQSFRRHVASAEQAGIRDEQMRAQYAMSMVRSEFLAFQYQQQQQQPANGQNPANTQFLQNAAAAQAALQQQQLQQPVVNPANGGQGRGRRQPTVPLAERLRQRFAAAGVDGSSLMAKPPAR